MRRNLQVLVSFICSDIAKRAEDHLGANKGMVKTSLLSVAPSCRNGHILDLRHHCMSEAVIIGNGSSTLLYKVVEDRRSVWDKKMPRPS